MKIAHITDIHLYDYLFAADSIDGKKNFKAIVEDISNRDIDKIILTGDMGDPDLFDWVIDSVKGTGKEYTYVLGNHDDLRNFAHRDDVKRKVQKTGLYYHEKIGSDLYLFLDSSSSEINDVQRGWIEDRLKESDYDRVIVFLHYPLLNCGNTTMDRLYPLLNRDLVKEMFIKSRKEVYLFAGHYHEAYEVYEENIKQFVTPSAVMQFKKHSAALELETTRYGYRIIDVKKGLVSSEVVLFSP